MNWLELLYIILWIVMLVWLWSDRKLIKQLKFRISLWEKVNKDWNRAQDQWFETERTLKSTIEIQQATIDSLKDTIGKWRKLAGECRMVASNATGIEAMVIADIEARQQFGINKYGKTVAESTDDMLQHAYEETTDLAIYLKAEIEKKKKGARS